MSYPAFTYSGVSYPSPSAGTTEFNLTTTGGKAIGFLQPSHIHVFTSTNGGTTLVELTRPAQWDVNPAGTKVVLATGIAAGTGLVIQRITPEDAAYTTFAAGTLLTASQLNDATLFNLYVNQETEDQSDATTVVAAAASAAATSATTTANTALTTANTSISTANTALTNANAAVSTANTASTNASAAVTTANTASTNATAAVTTANTASSTANTAATNASAAVTTANTASAAAASATTTANTAANNASTALSTANTAASNASAAVSTANTASSNATNAVNTANTASGNASTALSTANTASTNATTALNTANTANTKADAAIAAVASSVNYTPITNVAGIPASPANNTYIEIADSTGLESFTPLSGKPAGFVGDAGLSVRLRYTTSPATWTWLNYYANNSDSRYLKLAGGTLTGPLTLAGAPSSNLQPATKLYVDTADATLTSAAAAAQTTANAALPKAGGTMTGAITFAAGQSFPAGTTSAVGVVQLTDSTSSTSTTTAATPASVKSAYDLASTASTTATAALPKAGGTMTGNIVFAGTQPTATTSTVGIVQLTDSTSSASTATAATPASVKAAYDFVTVVSTTASAALPKAGGTMTGNVLHPAGTAAAPSIQVGTGTTYVPGIYSPAANSVAISTNGTGKLFVDASGNVGIGNSSQTSYNSAADNLVIGSTGSNGITIVSGSTNAGYIMFADGTVGQQTYEGQITYDHTNNYFAFNTSAAERLRLTSTGALNFVGAGTAGSTQAVSFNGSAPVNSLVIDSSGRLGLGTSSPSTLLHIQSTDPAFRFKRSDAAADAYGELTTDTGGLVTMKCDPANAAAGSGFRITVDNSEALRVDSSGRVGIGTTSVNSLLEVRGSSNNQNVLQISNSQGAANGGATSRLRVTCNGDTNWGNLDIQSWQTIFSIDGNEAARIDSSKRLLVGTSSTSSVARFVAQGSTTDNAGVLDIAYNGAATGLVSGNTYGALRFTTQSSSPNTVAEIVAVADAATSAGDFPSRLVFSTCPDSSATPVERLRIQNDGKVFIGTTSVSGSSYGANLVLSRNSGTTRWEVGPYNTATAFIITADTTNGVYLSSTTATAWSSASDERIKTDLEPIDNGLSKVASLRAVTGRFIADTEQPRKPFLIAQDVLEVLPEAVDTSNPDRYGLAYTDVIPLLVAALKESKERIEALEAKVAALEGV